MFIDAYEHQENLSESGKIGAVYDRLKAMVRENQLRPRRRLMADNIADYFRVSRTPVREALQRLGSELLIASTPSRGHFTKMFDVDENVKLYEFACLVCTYSIEKNIGSFQLEGILLEIDNSLRNIGNYQIETYASLIEKIYLHIVRRTDNAEMVRLIRNFIDRTHTVRLLDLAEVTNCNDIMAEIRRLMEVLAACHADQGTIILEQLVLKKIQRLPALVAAANDEATRASFP